MCVCKIYTNRFIDNVRGCAEHPRPRFDLSDLPRAEEQLANILVLQVDRERKMWMRGVFLIKFSMLPKSMAVTGFRRRLKHEQHQNGWISSMYSESRSCSISYHHSPNTPPFSRPWSPTAPKDPAWVNMCGEYPGIQHWMGKFKSTYYGTSVGTSCLRTDSS